MIRDAIESDVLPVLALERELFGVDAWTEDMVRDELAGEGHRFLISSKPNGEVSGYAVTRTAGEIVDLLRIGVRRDAQRRGLASSLLREALEGTQDATRMLLEVSVHNPAVAFYVSRQFNVIDVRPHYYRDGSEALVMCRWLPAANRESSRVE